MEQENKLSRRIKIWLTILILIVIYCICAIIFIPDAVENACKDMGFKDHDYWNSEHACVDEEDNYHFVKIECKNNIWMWWKNSCEAKLIKVGEVWGK